MESRPSPPAWPAALTIAVTWLGLYAAGFPLGFVDDLYFIGPAISLAHGGPFANPWCPAIGQIDPFSLSRFFVYLPLHGHVLAGWIMGFGLSTASLLAFQCLMGALATWGLERFMRPAVSAPLASFTLCLCVALYLGGCGLRPEGLALALFAWGLQILRTKSNFAWLACGLALAASMITSPNIGIMAPLVMVLGLVRRYRQEGQRSFVRGLAMLVLAVLVVEELFLYLIHFDLVEFLWVFDRARTFGAMASSTLKNYFLSSVERGPRYLFRFALMAVVPYMAMFVALALAWRRRDLVRQTVSDGELLLIALGGVFLLVPAWSSGTGIGMLGFYALVACLYVAARLKSARAVGYGAYVIFFLMMLRADGNFFVEVFSACIVPPSRPVADVRAELAQTPHDKVYIDGYALRAVFNYQIPENGLDYNFGLATHFAGTPTPKDFPADSVIVLSTAALDFSQTSLIHTPVVGFLLPDAPRNSYDFKIVRGEANATATP
jgi:hypothetical protein